MVIISWLAYCFLHDFASILFPKKVSYGACMLSKVDGLVWIIDSGASDHMASIKTLLFDIISSFNHIEFNTQVLFYYVLFDYFEKFIEGWF